MAITQYFISSDTASTGL